MALMFDDPRQRRLSSARGAQVSRAQPKPFVPGSSAPTFGAGAAKAFNYPGPQPMGGTAPGARPAPAPGVAPTPAPVAGPAAGAINMVGGEPDEIQAIRQRIQGATGSADPAQVRRDSTLLEGYASGMKSGMMSPQQALDAAKRVAADTAQQGAQDTARAAQVAPREQLNVSPFPGAQPATGAPLTQPEQRVQSVFGPQAPAQAPTGAATTAGRQWSDEELKALQGRIDARKSAEAVEEAGLRGARPDVGRPPVPTRPGIPAEGTKLWESRPAGQAYQGEGEIATGPMASRQEMTRRRLETASPQEKIAALGPAQEVLRATGADYEETLGKILEQKEQEGAMGALQKNQRLRDIAQRGARAREAGDEAGVAKALEEARKINPTVGSGLFTEAARRMSRARGAEAGVPWKGAPTTAAPATARGRTQKPQAVTKQIGIVRRGLQDDSSTEAEPARKALQFIETQLNQNFGRIGSKRKFDQVFPQGSSERTEALKHYGAFFKRYKGRAVRDEEELAQFLTNHGWG